MSSIRVGGGRGETEGNVEDTRGVSESVRATIQSIRETTGKQHSDDDILAVLEDCDMDANETVQRLLYIDTFHEVKRKPRKEEINGAHVRSPHNLRGSNFVFKRGNEWRNGLNHHRSLINSNASSAAAKNSVPFSANGNVHTVCKPLATSKISKHISTTDEKKMIANSTRLYSSVIQEDNTKLKSSVNHTHFDSEFLQHGLVNHDGTKSVVFSFSEEKSIPPHKGNLQGRPRSSDSTEMAVRFGQVIFPNHLKVPENVKNGLVFGNFDVKAGEEDKCAKKVVNETEQILEHSNIIVPIEALQSPNSDIYTQSPISRVENLNQTTQIRFEEAPVEVLPNCDNNSASTVEEISVAVTRSSTPTEQINLSPPPPPVIFRPPFHPNFLLYGHYINPYFFPPVHMFLSPNGHTQHTPNPNEHLSSTHNTPPAVKYPLPYFKTGPGPANLSPSPLPIYGAYGAPPAGIPPSNRAASTHSTDNPVYTTSCQSEGPTWIPPIGQDLAIQAQQLAFISLLHAPPPPPFPLCYQTSPLPQFPQPVRQPPTDLQISITPNGKS